MKNWKTTLAGIAMFAAGLISSGAIPTNANVQKIATGVIGAAGLAMGSVAKDHDVTGGTKQQ